MQCQEDKPFCSGFYFQRLQFREQQIPTEKLQVSKFYYPAVKKSKNECNMSDLCKFVYSYRCVRQSTSEHPGLQITPDVPNTLSKAQLERIECAVCTSRLGCCRFLHQVTGSSQALISFILFFQRQFTFKLVSRGCGMACPPS